MLVPLQGHYSFWLGRLSMDWVPYDNPIIVGAFVFACAVGLAIVAGITRLGWWGYLWREWVTTLDHKKIGLMYMIMGAVMLFRGFVDAVMIRAQQAMAAGPHTAGFLDASHGYLPPFHFDQVYGSHGTIMILFAVTPMLIGMMNIIVPLQVGARDMAYPFLNSIGLYLTAVGAALVMLSLFLGEFSHAGWVGLTPLSELAYSPGVGVDYWLWALQISGIGTTIGSINIVATIVKMRAPGMSWSKLPIFSWTSLSMSTIGITAFPILTVVVSLLTLDRYVGTHFFTAGLGGDLMLYKNLFWMWGHPEVYFLILLPFGVVSEIIANFSHKQLFGFTTMVLATFAIGGVSWTVWLHHFFVMGQGPGVNTYFGIATMLVGIPTGVKLFNWIFTMCRGRLHFEPPMLWATGVLFLLPIGGLSGVILAMVPADYEMHNSVFVIAHFHNMVMVTVFAEFAAITYWFPKIFGFKLDPAIGKRVFWCWVVAAALVFIPMYGLGLMGMTRRLSYVSRPELRPFFYIQEAGMFMFCVAAFYQFKQFYMSIRDRAKGVHLIGDGEVWSGERSVEWVAHSPVPFYNFAVTPHIHQRDEWAWRRAEGHVRARPERYVDIEMPKNTAIPFLMAGATFVFGFAMVWRIWWLGALSFAGVLGLLVLRSFIDDTEYTIPAADVEAHEQQFFRHRDAHSPDLGPIEQAGKGVYL